MEAVMTRWLEAARTPSEGFDKIDNTDKTPVLAPETLKNRNKVNSVNFVSEGFLQTPPVSGEGSSEVPDPTQAETYGKDAVDRCSSRRSGSSSIR
jgi:hypothetical protein